MSGGRTRGYRKKLGELLKAPFHRNKSRTSSPSPTPVPGLASSNTPANITVATPLSNPAQATGNQALNSQSPAIPVPGKNEAFEKAIQEHINNLSTEDKVAFQSATDVMKKLGELQQVKSPTSSSHTTRTQKVQKVLQCVKQFLASVAICIQHSPEISSLVVGGLHCVLTVSTS